MTIKYSECPQCGGRKPQMMACIDCGYNHLQSNVLKGSKTCPICGKLATDKHIKRETCAPKPKEKEEIKKKLPEWKNLESWNNIIDRSVVVSGGGVGVGKGEKKASKSLSYNDVGEKYLKNALYAAASPHDYEGLHSALKALVIHAIRYNELTLLTSFVQARRKTNESCITTISVEKWLADVAQLHINNVGEVSLVNIGGRKDWLQKVRDPRYSWHLIARKIRTTNNNATQMINEAEDSNIVRIFDQDNLIEKAKIDLEMVLAELKDKDQKEIEPKQLIVELVALWRHAVRIRSSKSQTQAERARVLIDLINREWLKIIEKIYDKSDYFVWPTTDIEFREGTMENRKLRDIGVLGLLGYHVGLRRGLDDQLRAITLEGIFYAVIPPVFSTDYLKRWGRPGSAKRLQRLANTIASLVKNAKYRTNASMGKSIRDWELDLEYLKREFYINKFNFNWPVV